MSIDPKDPIDSKQPDPSNLGFGAFGGSENTGFDYAAFEESLNASEEELEDDQLTDPGLIEEKVESRPTIDLRRFPQDDATWDTRELGKYTVVTIRGRVNESFPGEAIGEKLRGYVVFDLTEVERITSFGVRAWLQMLDLAKMKDAVFVRASPAVVNQVTMMRNFCGSARIHSLVAPYTCKNCGNEFGVTYEAIADRTALRARNPLLIECPQCRNAAELDEDPWVFFGIDDQLLDEISDDLAKVLENLGERPNHAPIEKSIVDDTTRVRFNGMVDGNTRFQRAFNGLEGNIVVDLRTASGVDDAGVNKLYDNLARLDPAISSVRLEGCPLALLERLQAGTPITVIDIRSVSTEVRSERRNMTRPVIIDLRRHRNALLEGKVPDLDIPWRDEPLTLQGLSILTEAVKSLKTEQPKNTTPIPIQQATSSSRKSPFLLPVALGGGGLLLIAGALAIYSVSQPIAPAPEPIPKVAVDGAWSTGGLLPPDWSERAMVTSGSDLLLAGIGSGESVSDALKSARTAALIKLLPQSETIVTTGFPDDALPATGPKRAEAEARWIGNTTNLPVERAKEASRKNAEGMHEVAVQYKLPKKVFDVFLQSYKTTGEFKGLTFTPRPPWTEPGLRLTKRASFLRKGEPGDLLSSVGGIPLTTLKQLEDTAKSAFDALQPGKVLSFRLLRDGKTITVGFTKARPTPAPSVAPHLQLPPE